MRNGHTKQSLACVARNLLKRYKKNVSVERTETNCLPDDFCKHFNAENAGNLLEDNSGVKRRRRQASLSDSEIMTILLYFHFGTFRNFKHYYLFFIKGTMKSYFPKAVSYNRFVELESRVFFQLMFFLNLGAFGRCTGITFAVKKLLWFSKTLSMLMCLMKL